jgi:hypothetical protein
VGTHHYGPILTLATQNAPPQVIAIVATTATALSAGLDLEHIAGSRPLDQPKKDH